MSAAAFHSPAQATEDTAASSVRQALRVAPLFRDLDDRVIDRLATISRIISVTEGHVICRQGEMADDLFIAVDGQLATSAQAANGTSAVVEVIRSGGAIGLATLLARLPRPMSARSIGQSRLLSIDAHGLLKLVGEESALVTALLRAEAEDFQALVRQVCDLKLRTTAQRLGCYLLSLTTDQTSNAVAFRLPFDKRLLAARLGCRQENLSRAFAALRSLGVETHGARVILHDITRLRDYALPDEPVDEVPA
jgi:CRP/FNR family transcriptional activator FtrB